MRRIKFLSPRRKKIIELNTDRLLLRQWRAEDLADFARINADPKVMEFYPNLLSTQESNAAADKFRSLITENGWGFWAVETISERAFIGLVGLHRPAYKLPFGPCVEIGWRVASPYWGKGYATEAAEASLKFAFDRLDLTEVYAFTSVANMKSRAVMERLRMVNLQANFDHPTIPRNSPLREHVVYKVDKLQWRLKQSSISA
jgi:RimJ/RimL family protein N-acetyltransferase